MSDRQTAAERQAQGIADVLRAATAGLAERDELRAALTALVAASDAIAGFIPLAGRSAYHNDAIREWDDARAAARRLVNDE